MKEDLFMSELIVNGDINWIERQGLKSDGQRIFPGEQWTVYLSPGRLGVSPLWRCGPSSVTTTYRALSEEKKSEEKASALRHLIIALYRRWRLPSHNEAVAPKIKIPFSFFPTTDTSRQTLRDEQSIQWTWKYRWAEVEVEAQDVALPSYSQ